MDEKEELLKRMYFDIYNDGWKAAIEHTRKQLIKDILSDGVISMNVDTDHLERIVRIIDEVK